MSITQTVVNRPVAVSIVFALFIGLAAFLVPSIPVELFPDMEMPTIIVNTTYTGAGPEDVEKNVTEVLEKQLSNVSDLQSISSTSSEGSSMVILEFDFSKDLDVATNDVRDKLELVSNMLPDDADSPIIFKMDSNMMPVMTLAVEGTMSQNELRKVAEDTVQPLIERIGGVSSVTVQGGQEQIVKVEVSQNRLEAYNLTLTSIASSLSTQNYQLGSGSIEEKGTDFLIRTDAEFSNLSEIENVIISSVGGLQNDGTKVIRLSDVADVFLDFEEEDSRVYINGYSGVTLSVVKESDANTISVSDRIQDALEGINRSLPAGTSLIVVSDSSTSIRSIMNQTYNSLFQGILLAMVVLFFFLRTWSSTIIIALSIPVSIFVTILFMYFMGLSLNLMTLTGLILGLGMVVDNSIVILENIFRYRERGTRLKASAILGNREMVKSITASTLTTVCVFIPMVLFADDIGMFGQIFKSLSWTIIIAMTVSLIVAVTLVPTLSANYLKVQTRTQKPLKNKTLRKIDSAFERGFNRLDNAYKKLLSALMNHRKKTLLLVFLLFVLTMMQIPRMGMVLAPPMSEDSFTVSMELPPGTTLDETEQQMENLLLNIEREFGGHYENLVVTIGESGMFGGSTESNKASVEITLPDYQNQTMSADEMKSVFRTWFNDFPAATLEFSNMAPGMGNSNPVDIVVQSDDLELAMSFSDELVALMNSRLPQIQDLSTDMDSGLPQIELVIDRDRAYSLGLNMYTVANEVSAGIQGKTATRYRTGGEELDVKVILREEDKSTVPDLNKIFVTNNKGTRIAVSNVASLERSTGPVSISRENEMRTIHILGGLAAGYSSTAAQADINSLLAEEVVIPDGISLTMGGDFEDIAEQGAQMVIVLVIAMILVFGVMAAQFESLKDPFIIFMTIPLMMIGVVWLYILSGAAFSLMSIVGLVVLVGLVVNNGIVMLDYTKMLLKRGEGLVEASVNAAGSRLKPILMTTFTTILGMYPLAFMGGAGTEQVQPIAQTIIGGLLVSSLMTLIVTPLLFVQMNRRLNRKQRNTENDRNPSEEERSA
ncbi:MAG: efflux RND transporter permease subunit [Spirochaetales bacterium]|nr:efflux RND transporter permease subunit [Spirochaetales bacterium]